MQNVSAADGKEHKNKMNLKIKKATEYGFLF
jgi:hypothetical protein